MHRPSWPGPTTLPFDMGLTNRQIAGNYPLKCSLHNNGYKRHEYNIAHGYRVTQRFVRTRESSPAVSGAGRHQQDNRQPPRHYRGNGQGSHEERASHDQRNKPNAGRDLGSESRYWRATSHRLRRQIRHIAGCDVQLRLFGWVLQRLPAANVESTWQYQGEIIESGRPWVFRNGPCGTSAVPSSRVADLSSTARDYLQEGTLEITDNIPLTTKSTS